MEIMPPVRSTKRPITHKTQEPTHELNANHNERETPFPTCANLVHLGYLRQSRSCNLGKALPWHLKMVQSTPSE